MSKKCETVIISSKAYNAMIRESFAKHPVETGGILLGYILDNGLWVVMEMIPPGINGVFQSAYFEYDQDFVNYLGTSVANQYKEPLQVLGLWHRHPGSMDYFSSTDDGTNSEFASKNPYGVISGLVNIDPAFRLTMYHLDHNDGVRPRNIAYTNVDVEVGDDLIPERFFELRYVDNERSELHPTPTHKNIQVTQTHSVPKSRRNGGNEAEMVDETKPEAKEKAQQQLNVVKESHAHKKRSLFITVAFAVVVLVGILIGRIIPWGVTKDNDEPETKTVSTSQPIDTIKPKTILAAIENTWSIKHFPYTGTFTEKDSVNAVQLNFILNKEVIDEAIYTNVKLGGKIKMKVEQINDSTIKLCGKDGSEDFTVELVSSNPEKLTGKASIGNKNLEVQLKHNEFLSNGKD